MRECRPIIEEQPTLCSPEQLVHRLHAKSGTILLRTGRTGQDQRYSFVTTSPFLLFRSWGSSCELSSLNSTYTQYGNPWLLLEQLISRYELLDHVDFPFPLGGCFGFWGYDLKNFVEPLLTRRTRVDLETPDCEVGFYDSLVVFDHLLNKTWIISTGLAADGTRNIGTAVTRLNFWRTELEAAERELLLLPDFREGAFDVRSNFSRPAFIKAVKRAQEYIRNGEIYQVNLSHRFNTGFRFSGWDFFQSLANCSPAPYSAYFHGSEFEIASSSPELFLKISGNHVVTRPIKGTRPRSSDPQRDAQLTYELQTSSKEMAELVMITDLLRNDLGRICEFGSIQVPELVRLERFAHVQHLVSTVEGTISVGKSHLETLAAMFPGGSITGAPKFRAMEIIDEQETVGRGPYTGCLGYIGFNRESQLNILIRTGLIYKDELFFNVGAGIVADSIPEREYEETMAKAAGFFAALQMQAEPSRSEPEPTH
jgi:para-aminobenzoate synthetase component 1